MKNRCNYIVVLGCLLFANGVNGQTLKAGVDRNKILIGEQVQLTLQIENVKNTVGWFNLPDSFNHLEVVERRKIDTLKIGKIISYRQVILLTSFDSGTWQIPGLAVQGISQTTKSISIEVLPVDVSGLIDYHDIKEIVEVEPETDWLLISLIALAVLFLIGMLYWFFKRKKRKPIKPKPVVYNQSTIEKALDELEKLEKEKLYNQGKVKEHYSRLVDISRTFFNESLGHSAQNKTTDEWMVQLQFLQVQADAKTNFFQLLRLADVVKFAKFQPPASENETSVNHARQMLTVVADWYKNIRSLNQTKA